MKQKLIKCYFIYLWQDLLLENFYDSTEEKARSQFVPAEDLVVPYEQGCLDDAEKSYAHPQDE